MRPLSAADLLTAWELGLDQTPAERGVTLLRAALPEVARKDLERLSVGQRDACLLSLREEAFGRKLESLASCPRCGDCIELSLDTRELRAESSAPGGDSVEEVGTEMSLRVGDYQARYRLPTTLDLLAAAQQKEPLAIRAVLLERCLLVVEEGGKAISAKELPQDIAEAVTARMSDADPQADVRLAVACPGCSHRWEVAFDILSYLWRELAAWGLRTIHEIHTLASTYGWSERQILDLSPARRRAYLELAAR